MEIEQDWWPWVYRNVRLAPETGHPRPPLPGLTKLCGGCGGAGVTTYLRDVTVAKWFRKTVVLGEGVCRDCGGHGRVRI